MVTGWPPTGQKTAKMMGKSASASGNWAKSPAKCRDSPNTPCHLKEMLPLKGVARHLRLTELSESLHASSCTLHHYSAVADRAMPFFAGAGDHRSVGLRR